MLDWNKSHRRHEHCALNSIGRPNRMLVVCCLSEDALGWLNSSAVRGEFPGTAVAPQSGEAAGVLLGGQGAPAGVRVHGQGQPGEPPLQNRAAQ
jgi:hypothetical protein